VEKVKVITAVLVQKEYFIKIDFGENSERLKRGNNSHTKGERFSPL
jgi:hypothetical protein